VWFVPIGRAVLSDRVSVRRIATRAILIAGVALCAAAPWPPWWISDLLAALAPWLAPAATLIAAALAVTRLRRWSLPPLALGVSTALLLVLSPRAPRAPVEMESVTILVLNANAAPLDSTLAFLRSHPADIAVLVEAPWDLFASAAEDAGYRWRLALGPQSGGPAVRAVLSQWQGEAVESGLPDQGVFAARFAHPEGAVAVVVAHPLSPRTLSRWREGARRTREAAQLASDIESRGVPTLVAGDFNSPPTGQRSRALGRAGFRRARPCWPPQGSYPAWAPTWASLAIDGVAVGEGISVTSWRVIEAPGSDHRAVLVGLALPVTAPGAAAR
jgi:endonuclease/exonuclease/phosphatase (EEP) superfamily protein YafD